jgi:hypothetical protein
VGWPEDRNTTHWLENRGTVPAWRSRSTSSGKSRPPADIHLQREGMPRDSARYSVRWPRIW